MYTQFYFKVREEVQAAKNDYEALNSQLKDELPRFNALVYDVFKDSVITFIQKYHRYQSDSLQLLYPLLQVSPCVNHLFTGGQIYY